LNNVVVLFDVLTSMTHGHLHIDQIWRNYRVGQKWHHLLYAS